MLCLCFLLFDLSFRESRSGQAPDSILPAGQFLVSSGGLRYWIGIFAFSLTHYCLFVATNWQLGQGWFIGKQAFTAARSSCYWWDRSGQRRTGPGRRWHSGHLGPFPRSSNHHQDGYRTGLRWYCWGSGSCPSTRACLPFPVWAHCIRFREPFCLFLSEGPPPNDPYP